MGSFLVNCGVSNSVLQEGAPIMLIFINRPLINREGVPGTGNIFNDWNTEDMMIPATQYDYGYSDIDEKYGSSMKKIMFMLFENSAEIDTENTSHPSWKDYFEKNIKTRENLIEMSFSNAQEHFRSLTNILQNNGVAYINKTHNVISMMKICHVDMDVIESIKNAPALIDSFYLEYNNNANVKHNRNTVENFQDYLKYITISRLDTYKDFLENDFFSVYDVVRENSAYHNYYNLLQPNYYNEEIQLTTIEEVINFAVYQRTTFHFFSYARILGVRFSPSLYASQDYSEYASRNNRNLMKIVFEKQKRKLIEKDILNGFHSEEDLDNGEISKNNSSGNIKKLMDAPEVVSNDENKLIIPSVIGYEVIK